MAEFKPNYDTNRTPLRDVIPLPSPYTVVVEITRFCNLRCYFCAHYSRGTEGDLFRKSGLPLMNMEMELYDKLVADLMALSVPPRLINFVGMGETLLHPQLGEMLRRLRKAGYTGKIRIATNGIPLTPKLSDELTKTGPLEFQISINGLSSEQYLKNTAVRIDYEKLVDNIRYLYEHKRDSRIYVKIIDGLLETPEDREHFLKEFDPIADQINIEHFLPMEDMMDDYDGKIVYDHKNMHGESLDSARGQQRVCSTFFYNSHVNAEGYVFACAKFGMQNRFAIGNLKQDTFQDLWNGETRTKMLLAMLKDGSDSLAMCDKCYAKYCLAAEEDRLDDCAGALYEKLAPVV